MPKDRSRSRSRSRTRTHHRSSHRHRTPSSTRSESPDHHRRHHRHHRSSDRPPREHRDRSRSRSRSRSRDRGHHHHSSSSRHHSSRHHHHHRSSKRSPSPGGGGGDRKSRTHKPAAPPQPPRTDSPPPVLPFNSRPLSKHDFQAYEALFAEYLDIQKGIVDLKALSQREVVGRFKRFVSHWNRGELAKGWYDPTRRVKAIEAALIAASTLKNAPPTAPAVDSGSGPVEAESALVHVPRMAAEGGGSVSRHGGSTMDEDESESEEEESSDDDIVGPTLPGMEPTGRKAGAKFPTLDELDEQKERSISEHFDARAQLKHDRKLDRAMQRAQLDEIAPRAAAGTHERKIEKKKELNEKMRSFREKSPDGEVDEATLMGGGGGTDNFKQLKAAKDRKKNERELRKEAMLRSRMEERESRLRAHREKEERTIAMLKALAENAQKRA